MRFEPTPDTTAAPSPSESGVRRLTELLGLNLIYSVTVGSSSRLFGPFKSIGRSCLFFCKREINMEDPTFVCMFIYITT